MKRLAAIGLVLALVATPALATKDSAPDVPQALRPPASFDGVWLGTIHFDKEAFLSDTGTPGQGMEVRIEIDDSVVRVFDKRESDFREVMEGGFHIAAVKTNAVIYGTHWEDVWVESWSFTATQKDDDTLIVNFARVVNNRDMPLSEPDSKFSTRGAGEFKRVRSP